MQSTFDLLGPNNPMQTDPDWLCCCPDGGTKLIGCQWIEYEYSNWRGHCPSVDVTDLNGFKDVLQLHGGGPSCSSDVGDRWHLKLTNGKILGYVMPIPEAGNFYARMYRNDQMIVSPYTP